VGRLNTPAAFVVALVIVLVVDGFLLYRYRLTTEETTATAPPPATTQLEDTRRAPSAPSTTQKDSTRAEGTTKTGPATTEGAATTPAEQPDVLRVIVGVVEAPSFLSIEVDGQNVFEGDADPGFSRRFEAEREVGIRAGNAGVVEVQVDGENLGRLGASGEVAARTFTR